MSAIELGRSFTSMLGVLDASAPVRGHEGRAALPATALYGHPTGRELPVKEGGLTPRGVRGVVAKAIVDLLSAYREDFGIEFTALALSSVYGPRQRPDGGVVAAMVAAAAKGEAPRLSGDGRQSRDFVYVDDVVDALVRSGQRGSGLVVNIGTGVQTTLREVWSQIAPNGPVPTHTVARPDEVLRFAVSPGARPHPPRLVAVDHPRRRPRGRALAASSTLAQDHGSTRRRPGYGMSISQRRAGDGR